MDGPPHEGTDMKTETNEVQAEPRKRLPLTVDDQGRAIILRAITLRLATLACCEGDDLELHGAALGGICRIYLEGEAARLRGERG